MHDGFWVVIQAKLLEILSASLKVEHFTILINYDWVTIGMPSEGSRAVSTATALHVISTFAAEGSLLHTFWTAQTKMRKCYAPWAEMTIAFAFSATSIRHLKIFPASNMINKAQKKMRIPNKARNWWEELTQLGLQTGSKCSALGKDESCGNDESGWTLVCQCSNMWQYCMWWTMSSYLKG